MSPERREVIVISYNHPLDTGFKLPPNEKCPNEGLDDVDTVRRQRGSYGGGIGVLPSCTICGVQLVQGSINTEKQ